MAKIRLHPGQSTVYNDLFVKRVAKYATVVASRGWGKSYFAATTASTAVSELLRLPKNVGNKRVGIIAPTYAQVTDIYFPMLLNEFNMIDSSIKYSKDLGRFWFPNDVELQLISYEAVERMRGLGFYFIVMDEPSSWTKGLGFKEAWQGVIQPCITTRWSEQSVRLMKARHLYYNYVSPGRAIAIGTPKGYNHFYDMYNYQERDKEWKSYHFDYTSSPMLDVEAIERLKLTLDPMEFNREYKALFEDSGARVFYNFSRKLHVTNQIVNFGETEDVHIGIDFNVGLQASSVFALRGKQPQFIDEFKNLPDTEQLAKAINGRYKNGKRKIYVYPDPTGNSRKTSAVVGTTDFTILRDHGLIVCARTASPLIVDSVKAVNRLMLTASGAVNFYVHPRCEGIIRSLERTNWLDNNPDTAALDKKGGDEHFSDSVRYPMEYLFPVVSSASVVKRGFKF